MKPIVIHLHPSVIARVERLEQVYERAIAHWQAPDDLRDWPDGREEHRRQRAATLHTVLGWALAEHAPRCGEWDYVLLQTPSGHVYVMKQTDEGDWRLVANDVYFGGLTYRLQSTAVPPVRPNRRPANERHQEVAQ